MLVFLKKGWIVALNIKSMHAVQSVHRAMFGTSEEYYDIMNTLGDLQYIWGYHKYFQRISWNHRGIFRTLEEFHESYVWGETSCVHKQVFSTSGLSWFLRPWCMWDGSWIKTILFIWRTWSTKHFKMYLWYPPSPHQSWFSSSVMHISKCTNWYHSNLLDT